MTSVQRMEALDRANAVRLARADLRRCVRTGERSFQSVLDELPECCAKLPAFEILQWCPRVGLVRARKLTYGIISETLPLRCVYGSSRERLLAKLRAGGVK